jgi:drug/metabolite transporter (DMT)-like permease
MLHLPHTGRRNVHCLLVQRIALLRFVYPAAALLMDWALYGRALGAVQWLGVGLMALALTAVRRTA